MKKERIVGLCICVLLLGSIQTVWPLAMGIARFGVPGTSWTVQGAPQMTPRSTVVAAMAYSGWPPLGFFLADMHLLHKAAKNLDPGKGPFNRNPEGEKHHAVNQGITNPQSRPIEAYN
jgi:hypothetical protein